MTEGASAGHGAVGHGVATSEAHTSFFEPEDGAESAPEGTASTELETRVLRTDEV